MKDTGTRDLSWDERSAFNDVVDAALSRRGFLGGVLAFGSGATATRPTG